MKPARIQKADSPSYSKRVERMQRDQRMARITKALAQEAGLLNEAVKTKTVMLATWRGPLRITGATYGYDGLWVRTGEGLNASSFSLGNDGSWAKVMSDAGIARVAGWDGNE